jgi:hypothetical protein
MAHWRSAPQRKGGLGFLHWGTQRMELSEWVRLQLALDPGQAGLERALQPVIEAQGLGTLARSLNATATLDDVRRELLAPGRGVLLFLPAMDSSHVFAIDGAGIVHDEIASRDALLRSADALAATWTSAPSGDGARRERFLAAARAFGDDLLRGEVRARVAGWSCCIVVGADLIGSPALECTVLDGAQPFGLTHAIAYLPSLPVGVALARRSTRDPRTTDIALLAAPTHGAVALERYASSIPFEVSAAELAGLTRVFDAGRIELLTGEDATRAALNSPRVRGAVILSILAHGAYDVAHRDDGERPSLLILAPGAGDDGLLWCSDVEALSVAPLVELLACGTARGQSRLGDDAAGHLVGAFMIAGAHTVIAAHHDLGREAALELARVLHERLREHGESTAEALRFARAELASHPSTSDPWYWAGLTANGCAWLPLFEPAPRREAPAPKPADSSSPWLLAGIGLGVAAVAVVMLARARRK